MPSSSRQVQVRENSLPPLLGLAGRIIEQLEEERPVVTVEDGAVLQDGTGFPGLGAAAQLALPHLKVGGGR